MKNYSSFFRGFILATAFLACRPTLHAQLGNAGYYRQGDKLFLQKDYYEAAQYFEKYLEGEKKSGPHAQPFAIQKIKKGGASKDLRHEAVYHLAECYREIHDYTRAEKRYREASSFSEKAYPECFYWYGVALRANGKFTEAEEAITKFEKDYTEMGPILMNADRELESLRFILDQQARKNKDNFSVTRQPNSGNTSAYALSVRHGDTVAFTSIHAVDPGPGKGKTEYYNDLYTGVDGKDMIAASSSIGLPPEKGVQHGLASFTADGNKMFLTRWTKRSDSTRAAIYYSERSDTKWSLPVRLGEPVNVEGYNSTQPSVTSDGRWLLFASDRPGGVGKYDLWYAELDSNFQALSVNNMGEAINTPGDEEAPFYHSGSRTLIFSSNGRAGMGGFDIFYSRGNFNFSQWEKPRNPGIPINSSKDDLYFVSTDEDNFWNTGWLSSDRETDCCLALYSVRQDNTQYVSGSVIDCGSGKPVGSVQLTVTDPRNKTKPFSTVQTDSLGNYKFELKNASRFRIVAEAPGYHPGVSDYTVYMETGIIDTFRNKALCLKALTHPAKEEQLKAELVALSRSSVLGNFPYKKHSLPKSAYANLDSLISLMNGNPTIRIRVEGYTDAIGGEQYNLRLSKARVDACIHYLVRKGIDPARLEAKALGKCCPVAPDSIDGKDNPEGREKNRRVEYKLIP